MCLLRKISYSIYINLISSRSYSKSHHANKLSSTILIPKSDMPSRQKVTYEEEIIKSNKYQLLYDQQSENHGKVYVLHDGPPYANGSIHLGHILNKTVKDISARFRMRKGQPVHFVPGWDCHGLPIELRVYQQNSSLINADPNEIRKSARKLAVDTVQEHIETFKRLGVIADWKNPYLTLSNDFVINQLQAFYKLYSKDLIFRDVLPTYFSPSSLTTLAESELEYNHQHTSPAVYVAFPITSELYEWKNEPLWALIWTTTPWTLFANQAIAFSPKLRYIIAYSPKHQLNLIIARDCKIFLEEKLGTILIEKKELSFLTLPELTYFNPITSRKDSPFVRGEHVTSEKGSGLVHIAPNHGHEDFFIAVKNNLPTTLCAANDQGLGNSLAHPALADKNLLTEGSQAAKDVLKKYLIHEENYVHSYPYDWRTKEPVIIRTSNQWFLDLYELKDKCLERLADVTFYPEGVKKKIIDDLSKRPQWCISRQRVWGVPIPIFYVPSDDNQKEETILCTQETIDYLCELVKKESIDCWWQKEVSELLPENLYNITSYYGRKKIRKSLDIFDVWFDSGLTWNSALKNDKISDVYMEGLDQCKGWFQSSLVLSTAIRDVAPYKAIYVHGFTVDKEGHKMSKSVGNVIDPIPLLNKKYGADVLRFFMIKHGSLHGNISVSDEILKTSQSQVNEIRNKLRFCLGAIKDLKEPVDYVKMKFIDQLMLHYLYEHANKCDKFYDNYDFRSIVEDSISLIDRLSSFYLKICKDRLYCDPATSLSRSSCQTVIKYSLEIISNYLCSMMPFLFEEIFTYMHPNKSDSSLFTSPWFDPPSHWNNENSANLFSTVITIKNYINANTADVKHYTKPFDVTINCYYKNDFEMLESINTCAGDNQRSELAEILQVPLVKITQQKFDPPSLISESKDIKISNQDEQFFPFQVLLEETIFFKCARCFLHTSESSEKLCTRCSKIC